MDLLLLGGPQFLGRAMIDAALAEGHNVTSFNRGRTNPQLYPDIEKLHGDRDGGLGALSGRRWDAVIDNSGYVPRIVRQSAEALAGAVGRYVFTSTISVYRHFNRAVVDEDDPVADLGDETEEVGPASYGPLKALCENAVQDIFADRATIIRPGLIVGPHDPTGRFTYWVTRTARGGEALAPVGPDFRVQVIDVRDLAAWTLRMAAGETGGVYNATGPERLLTLGELLDTSRRVSGSDARFTWVSEDFLLENEVQPWSDLPLWLPSGTRIHEVSIDRAVNSGLNFRPLEETVRDTLTWARSQPEPEPLAAGLTPEREAALLAKWHAL